MAAMYEREFLSLAEIARRLDRPTQTVSDTLRRLGVEKRPRGRLPGTQVIPDVEIERAGFMYGRLGMTIQEIADAYGWEYASAHLRVHYSGVRVLDRSESLRARRIRRAA